MFRFHLHDAYEASQLFGAPIHAFALTKAAAAMAAKMIVLTI